MFSLPTVQSRVSGFCPKRFVVALSKPRASACLTGHDMMQECGFVNFIDPQDAVRAKEDVLNRLGGNIGMPNGQLVRIGFGKVDSAPMTPLAGGAVNNTPASPLPGQTASRGSSFAAGLNSVNATTSGGPGDSQLQSSPTRALWIGSIPATTTPATILSVFSPFGPIESARVLTHKNCGFSKFDTSTLTLGGSWVTERASLQSTLSDLTMRSALARPSTDAMFLAVTSAPLGLATPESP